MLVSTSQLSNLRRRLQRKYVTKLVRRSKEGSLVNPLALVEDPP